MILELEFRTESESDEEGEVLNLVEKLARQGQNLDLDYWNWKDWATKPAQILV